MTVRWLTVFPLPFCDERKLIVTDFSKLYEVESVFRLFATSKFYFFFVKSVHLTDTSVGALSCLDKCETWYLCVRRMRQVFSLAIYES